MCRSGKARVMCSPSGGMDFDRQPRAFRGVLYKYRDGGTPEGEVQDSHSNANWTLRPSKMPSTAVDGLSILLRRLAGAI